MKLLVCCGTGGVGKTTVAAALGLAAAQKGLKTLVMTIDPSKRLAQVLKLDERIGEKEVAIDFPGVQGKLFGEVSDPRRIFEEFVRKHASHPDLAEKLLRNHLFHQMMVQLHGSQEFTSLERTLTLLEEGNYDLIVLDTPPVQHVLDTLHAPEHLGMLFSESVMKWFLQKEEDKKSLIQKIVHRGTHLVLQVLEKMTGAYFVRELVHFFEEAVDLRSTVQDRVVEMGRRLRTQETKFLLVTTPSPHKLKETTEFFHILKNQQLNFLGFVINRCWPFSMNQEGQQEQNLPDAYWQKVYADVRGMSELEHKDLAAWNESWGGVFPVVRIPDWDENKMESGDLQQISERVRVLL